LVQKCILNDYIWIDSINWTIIYRSHFLNLWFNFQKYCYLYYVNFIILISQVDLIEVDSSLAGVDKSITISTCEKTEGIDEKNEVSPKPYTNLMCLHAFQEN
jgi:hypothetical protein